MPAFALPDLMNGRIISSALHDKKNLLVVLTAGGWCPPCVNQMKALQRIQDKYGRQQLSIIVVFLDRYKQGALNLIKQHELTYPFVMENRTLKNGFSLSGVPVCYFVDENKNIVKEKSGFVPYDSLEAEVKKMLRN